MANTILYSAVDDTEQQFPQHVAEMREFLSTHKIPAPSVAAVPALAAALQAQPDLRDDLFSMLYVIRLGEPGISTLQLLAILLVAATGTDDALSLQGQMPASGSAARELFQFVKSATRVSEPEDFHDVSETASFGEEAPWTQSVEAQPWAAPLEDAAYTGAGLSRALALSAEEEAPAEAEAALALSARTAEQTRLPEPVQAQPAALPEATFPAPAQAQPLLLHQAMPPQQPLVQGAWAPATEEVEEPHSRYRWLYAACGVLLGLLLGFLVERQRLARETAQPSTAATLTPDAASAGTAPGARRREVTNARSVRRTHGSRRNPAEGVSAGPAEASDGSQLGSPDAGYPVAPAASGPGAAPAPSRTPASHSGLAGRPGLVKGLPLGPASDQTPAPTFDAIGGFGRVTAGTAGIMAANVLSSPAPAYPVQASAAAVQGEVVVEAIVGRDGDIIDTRVVSGPLLLREAALQAVQRWHYRPFEVDGRPVEIATTARFDFRLGH